MTLHDRVYIYIPLGRTILYIARPCCPASPPYSAIWPRTHALMATTADTKKWRRKIKVKENVYNMYTQQERNGPCLKIKENSVASSIICRNIWTFVFILLHDREWIIIIIIVYIDFSLLYLLLIVWSFKWFGILASDFDSDFKNMSTFWFPPYIVQIELQGFWNSRRMYIATFSLSPLGGWLGVPAVMTVRMKEDCP